MNAASIKENGHLLAAEQNGGAPQRCGSASMLQLSQLQSQRQYSMNSLHRAAVAAAAGCPQPAATGSTFASPIHQQLVHLSPAHGACRYALASTNPNSSPVYVPSDAVDVNFGVGEASAAGDDERAGTFCPLHDPSLAAAIDARSTYVGFELAGGCTDLTLARIPFQSPPPQFATAACSCCLVDPQANGGFPHATVLTNGGGILCQSIPEEAHGDEYAHNHLSKHIMDI